MRWASVVTPYVSPIASEIVVHVNSLGNPILVRLTKVGAIFSHPRGKRKTGLSRRPLRPTRLRYGGRGDGPRRRHRPPFGESVGGRHAGLNVALVALQPHLARGEFHPRLNFGCGLAALPVLHCLLIFLLFLRGAGGG